MAKDLHFCGDSRDVLRSFPEAVRVQFGQELRLVQNGKLPTDSKPMTAVGAGVREIRVMHHGQYRVFYLLAHLDAIYVLHAFIKKSQKTSKLDIAKGRQRIKEYGL